MTARITFLVGRLRPDLMNAGIRSMRGSRPTTHGFPALRMASTSRSENNFIWFSAPSQPPHHFATPSGQRPLLNLGHAGLAIDTGVHPRLTSRYLSLGRDQLSTHALPRLLFLREPLHSRHQQALGGRGDGLGPFSWRFPCPGVSPCADLSSRSFAFCSLLFPACCWHRTPATLSRRSGSIRLLTPSG